MPLKGPSTELERLQRERNELVQTGCYTDQDALIQDMDRQIKANQLRLETDQNY
jgi:hypothetical protein